MAQTVQLLGTIVHEPRLIVLDEPFSGLDALNQQKLEQLIRDQAAAGVTVIFSTHVIAHAERLCERIAIIAEGRAAFEGAVDEARGRLRPIVHLRTRSDDGPWRAALPASAKLIGGEWRFELPASGPEPLLKALIDGGAGIETLSIERPGLHDAFIAIAGEAAAREMGQCRSIGGSRMKLPETIRAAFVIARRDFTATVLSKTFLFFLLGPLFPILHWLRLWSASGRRSSGTPRRRRWPSSSSTQDFALLQAATRTAVAAGRRCPLVELAPCQSRARPRRHSASDFCSDKTGRSSACLTAVSPHRISPAP